MSDFELPPIRPDAKPEFTDASTCAAWLGQLPVSNVGFSHGKLLGQLEELNCFELATSERLKVLELLREPVLFVQPEHAKKFANRPVPLSGQEREIFDNVIALWDALCHGYQRCLQTPGDAAQTALACERVLWCVGQRMTEKHKAYREISGDDWKLLHRTYVLGEDRGVVEAEVPHPVYKGKVTTCVESYARTLLLDLANPNEHAPRQIALILRWLERWSRKVTISRSAPGDEGMPLSVDVAGSSGPTRSAQAQAGTRYLDIRAVVKSVQKRVTRLRRGESPAALGLGEDVPPAAAEQLLMMLYRQWCKDKESRAHPRRNAGGPAQICCGLAAVHHHISGKPFRQPVGHKELTPIQHQEIATFGRVATREDHDPGDKQDLVLENWQLKDESVGGLRLERLDPAATGRYQLHQLLALRPADSKSFMLGMVQWLSVSADSGLRAGIRTFPGIPQGVAVRATGLNATTEKYSPAVFLPAVPALQLPEYLVVPAGWYRPQRIIEVYRENSSNVMLSSLLERGSDFERVEFQAS